MIEDRLCRQSPAQALRRVFILILPPRMDIPILPPRMEIPILLPRMDIPILLMRMDIPILLPRMDILTCLFTQALEKVFPLILLPLSTNLSLTRPTRNAICSTTRPTSHPNCPPLRLTPSTILTQQVSTNNNSSPICPPPHRHHFTVPLRRIRNRFSTTPSTLSSQVCPNFLKPLRSLRTHMCLICISYMLLKTLRDYLRSLQH